MRRQTPDALPTRIHNDPDEKIGNRSSPPRKITARRKRDVVTPDAAYSGERAMAA